MIDGSVTKRQRRRSHLVLAASVPLIMAAAAGFGPVVHGWLVPAAHAAEHGGSCSDCGSAGHEGGGGRGGRGMGAGAHSSRRGMTHDIYRGPTGGESEHSGSAIESHIFHGRGKGGESVHGAGEEHESTTHTDH